MAPITWLCHLLALASVTANSIYGDQTPFMSPPRLQDDIVPLTSSQIAGFKPYTWYAATTDCNISSIMDWSCGENCNANPTFKPIATGGEGEETPFCTCLRVASGDIWGSRTCSPVCSISRVFGVRPDPWRGHRKPPRHRLREPVSSGYYFGSEIPADFGRLRSSQNVHSPKRTGPPGLARFKPVPKHRPVHPGS